MADAERRDLLEVIEDRHGLSSTIVASQLPIESWHDNIGDPTLADAILDRLIHNAHKINLKGDSMRKKRAERHERGSVIITTNSIFGDWTEVFGDPNLIRLRRTLSWTDQPHKAYIINCPWESYSLKEILKMKEILQ